MFSENLCRLRARQDLTQAKVAQKAGLSLLAYRNIETGKSVPKGETVQRLAAAFGVPLAELLAPVEPLRAVRFRAQKRMTRRGQVLAEVARWLADFNELEGALDERRPYAFERWDARLPRATQPRDRALRAAQKARAHLALTEDETIRDICGLLESAGVKLLPLVLESAGFFGLSVAPQVGGPAIVVNVWGRISVERWIFTAAHELGHLLLHLDSFDVDETEEDPGQEDEANRFASHFLMPEKVFAKEWEETYGLAFVERVLKVKRIFSVSYKSVLYRLIESHGYPDNLWREFQLQYRRLFGKHLGGSDEPCSLSANGFLASAPEAHHAHEPSELDRWDFVEDRLRRLVRLGVERERISLSRGAEILGLKLHTMREMVAAWEV